MNDPRKDSRVDAYLDKQEPWKEHFLVFREVLLATELQETIKWGIPTYTLNGSNVLGYAGFKAHCALWFYSGSFLQDGAGKLHNAQEGKTRYMRQWRFHAGEEVPQDQFRSYVQEAIDNQKAGKVGRPEPQTLTVPQELQDAMRNDAELRGAFARLTPGRQREYAVHIGDAKQEKTRLARLHKARPMILAGVGLNDRYQR